MWYIVLTLTSLALFLKSVTFCVLAHSHCSSLCVNLWHSASLLKSEYPVMEANSLGNQYHLYYWWFCRHSEHLKHLRGNRQWRTFGISVGWNSLLFGKEIFVWGSGSGTQGWFTRNRGPGLNFQLFIYSGVWEAHQNWLNGDLAPISLRSVDLSICFAESHFCNSRSNTFNLNPLRRK